MPVPLKGVATPADNVRMTAPTSTRPAAYTYVVVEVSQHYRKIDGRWYRDAVARRSDGELRLISIPEPATAVAA